MDSNTISTLLIFFQTYGYIAVFLGVIIEGPFTILISSFAASLGLFNIYFVFLVCLLAIFLVDFVYYFTGKFLGRKVIEKYGKYFGLSKKRIRFIESRLKDSAGRIIVFLKLAPFTVPALSVVGAFKVPLKKFAFFSFITNLGAIAVLTLLGFYSGVALTTIAKYLKLGSFIFLLAGVLIVLVYVIFLYLKKLSFYRISDLQNKK